jgi:hypothetical protein
MLRRVTLTEPYRRAVGIHYENTFSMRSYTLLFCLLWIISIPTFSQNENDFRNEFVLKIPVDGKQYYEQKIERTPYFVHENVLQIYPGEELYIEIEISKDTIYLMKAVKENINPDKTIKVKFSQEIENNKSKFMMLEVVNPFNKDLNYKAMMYIVGHNKWINTNVLPVTARLSGFEMWSDVIITMVLTDWDIK